MKEKIAKSLNADDLELHEWEDAVTVLAGLGAAQINRAHTTLGALLHHVRAGHTRFLGQAARITVKRVLRIAKRDRWAGVKPETAKRIALLALDFHISPNCENCRGVGQLGGPGDGTVIVLCEVCKGSGKRKLDHIGIADLLGVSFSAFRKSAIEERIKDVVDMLGRCEGYATAGTKSQVRVSK